MRYSGAPWQPLRSSTHVAVRIARGGFFAAFRGKLVTPRLLSHGSVAKGHRGQSPTPANANVTVAAGPDLKLQQGSPHVLTTVLNIRHFGGVSKQLLRGEGQLLFHLQGGTEVRTGSSTSLPCPQAWQTLKATFWGHTYPAPRLAVLLHRALPAQRGLGHTHSCPQLHQGLVKISWATPVHQDIGHVPGETAVRGTGICGESIPGPLPASYLSGRDAPR